MRAHALLWLLTAACGSESADEAGYQPTLYCPGDPTGICEPLPGTPLFAGAASRSILPACYESWTDLDGDATYESDESFADCGCDRLCAGDPDYPGPDEGEGDEVFQASWIGGFQNARAATGVRGAELGLRGEGDGLWARALALSQGHTSLVIVALDSVGTMYDDALAAREAVAAAGLDVDHLVVHSTHVHEAPDMMGIWGPSITETGYDPDYATQIHQAIVEATAEALDARVEVSMELGQADATDYWSNGIANLIRDSRDPVVIDPRVGVARFAARDGRTVASLVHWANHPETVADDNTLFTSDYAHALRRTVEDGVKWGEEPPRDGVGGTTVFINGSVGGMMTSLGAEVVDPLGQVWSDASFEKADVVGQLVGEMALDALEEAEPVDLPELWLRTEQLYLPVDNTGFQAMFLLDVLAHRNIYNWDPDQPIDEGNIPEAQSEVNLIGIGPLRILSMPGELLPELAIGGYDGAWVPPGGELVDPDNPNPPDLSTAPTGPYLEERVGGDPTWILGLGNDEIGYIIPEYNFIVADAGAYIFEAEGDHYEETNSLGPRTAGLLQEAADRLIAFGE